MSLLDSFLLDPHAFHVWIAYRTDGNKGSGTVNDPYNGSTQAAFDAAMAGLPDDQPLHIHLGPSPRDESGTPIPFRTGGCWVKRNPDNIGQSLFGCAWLPKPNMAIVGSGIDVTVLKLADVPSNGTEQRHYFAIGAPTTSPTDFLEISDLTIDCNQPSNADVACGAIRVMGHHVRIRRVKCINWGNRANQGNHPGNVICLIVVDPDPGSPVLAADDAGIEDCIAVGGSTSNVLYEIGIFHVGGAGYGFGAITQFGRAPFIRNCLIDGGTTDPYLNVHGCSMDGCLGLPRDPRL